MLVVASLLTDGGHGFDAVAGGEYSVAFALQEVSVDELEVERVVVYG